MELIIVSIGVLSKNPLWNERVPVRSSHATTTLLREKTAAGEVNILVDPSLPADILEARLHERAGIHSDQITHVFLTNWRPVHRRGIERFGKARWLMHETEIQAASEALDRATELSEHQQAPEHESLIKKEQSLLDKIHPASDDLAEGVQLYPLSGYTPGQCGLIVTTPTLTTIIAGDAVPTAAYFAAGQVFPDCWDLQKAKDSLMELYEVADLIVPGHDNLFLAPRATGL